jgi:hypothetical protein
MCHPRRRACSTCHMGPAGPGRARERRGAPILPFPTRPTQIHVQILPFPRYCTPRLDNSAGAGGEDSTSRPLETRVPRYLHSSHHASCIAAGSRVYGSPVHLPSLSLASRESHCLALSVQSPQFPNNLRSVARSVLALSPSTWRGSTIHVLFMATPGNPTMLQGLAQGRPWLYTRRG